MECDGLRIHSPSPGFRVTLDEGCGYRSFGVLACGLESLECWVGLEVVDVASDSDLEVRCKVLGLGLRV